MRRRQLPYLAGAVLAVACTVLFGLVAWNRPHKSDPKVCTTNACIQITQEDGSVYYVNNFTFLPGDCVEFWSLPGNVDHKTCGKFQLKWVGPVGGTQV